MIIGTAGHIDHGKTLLVTRLTGTDTDRLKAEKQRGISIELGFAYLPIPKSATPERPEGEVLGFVDVPGHEKFVHTMVAGATGIDFALIVVAADDGVMPQTREHLQILELLGITEGVVALNKIDLADAAGRTEAEASIVSALRGTGFEGIDILPVSAATGEGIDALRRRLLDEAASRPDRPRRGRFRMAIDRCFTLPGAGTVVTGAVRSGEVGTGDRVRVLPSGQEVRIRSLHAQGREAARALTGERCALNLAGIAKDALGRGDWLVAPGGAEPTGRFDARLTLLATEPRPVRTWSAVRLHAGTARVGARIVILEGDRVRPGQTAPVQIVADRPLPLVFGDRFILRDPAAGRSIGGGYVIDPRAGHRHRRAAPSRARRAALDHEDPAEALEALLALDPGFADLDGFAAARGLSEGELQEVLALLEPALFNISGRRHAARPDALAALAGNVTTLLEGFHSRHPDLPGMPPESLRRSLQPRLSRDRFEVAIAMLAAQDVLASEAGSLRLPTHRSRLGASDRVLWERLGKALDTHRFHPPPLSDLAESLNQPVGALRRLCKTMTRLGALAEIRKDRFMTTPALIELARLAQGIAAESPGGTLTVIAFRDRAGCGRGIAVQVLEYFDRRGLTIREGNARRLLRPVQEVFADLPTR